MNVQSISAIIFILFMLLFLIINRKKIVIHKILFPLFYLAMYKTRLGLKFMDRFAKRFSKSLKHIGTFGVFVGFSGMILIAYLLVKNVYNLLTKPEAIPGAALVLPFEVRGAFYVPFFYWIISIFIIAIVHEFSHGIIARKYGMKIKSSGFAFLCILLPVIPAAFVEPNEDELRKRPAKEQLSVFAAGPFANIILAFIVVGITILIAAPLSDGLIEEDGVLITGIIEGYPAKEAGLSENDIIYRIDGVEARFLKNFSDILQSKKPGDNLVIQTNSSSYEVRLAENPEKEGKAYLGIYVQQKTKIRDDFVNKYGRYAPIALVWLMGLLYWLGVLNLGIGLFNLVPMGPLDGGRMLLVALQHFFEEKKAIRYWKNIGFFFLALVVVNLLFAFIR